MTSPSSLMLALAENDLRLCFAFDISSKQFIYTNPAFESFFGLNHTQISSKSLLAMVYAEDQDYLKSFFADLQPGDFKNNIEFRVKAPDRKDCIFRLSLFYGNQQDKECIVTGYMEDVTDFKAQNEKLQEYFNKKKVILNILSHDLAAPLGSIQNLSALLSRKTKIREDKEVAKWISLIENISKKSINVIQEFVKQEFVESGPVVMEKK